MFKSAHEMQKRPQEMQRNPDKNRHLWALSANGRLKFRLSWALSVEYRTNNIFSLSESIPAGEAQRFSFAEQHFFWKQVLAVLWNSRTKEEHDRRERSDCFFVSASRSNGDNARNRGTVSVRRLVRKCWMDGWMDEWMNTFIH